MFNSASLSSNEYEVISGILDEDDMVVKAQEAQIQSFSNENGLFSLEVTKSGDIFDYDMQINVAFS